MNFTQKYFLKVVCSLMIWNMYAGKKGNPRCRYVPRVLQKHSKVPKIYIEPSKKLQLAAHVKTTHVVSEIINTNTTTNKNSNNNSALVTLYLSQADSTAALSIQTKETSTRKTGWDD